MTSWFLLYLIYAGALATDALLYVKIGAARYPPDNEPLLLTINHQSLIATKTSRIVRSAEGRPVMEFGARRAQGYDGAIYGARATYICFFCFASSILRDFKTRYQNCGAFCSFSVII